jgi:signal transduction histidine kinase
MMFTADAGLEKRWHSATSRLLLVYAIAFSCSVVVLFSAISHFLTGELERQNDRVMTWQLAYMRSVSPDRIVSTIAQRVERENLHSTYYGLFSPQRRWIAGDVVQFPANVQVDGGAVTLRHTLQLEHASRAPVTRVMAEGLTNGDILLVARDLTHIRDIRRDMTNTLVLGGLVSLIAGIAGGLILSMRQMKRLRLIRRSTMAISQGNLSERLPTGGNDEVDMLSRTVNHMLDEIERLMNEVKGACDGIAHDLRTPLAHLRTLLAQVDERVKVTHRGDASLYALISHAQGETDQLLERFRAMLRISEIAALRRRGGFNRLMLKDLIREVTELYEPLADSHGIRLSVKAETSEWIYGDRALLFEALSNVIDNAVKFTPSGGLVSVELRATSKGPQIDVVDDGPGIPEAERNAVTQRFYRGEKTRHVTGSGLGLSIVWAVLRMHDFRARIAGADPGTRVIFECWSHTLA